MSFLGKRHSYLGAGLIQIKDFGALDGYRSMSAQRSITMAFEPDEKRQQNTQRPGGGTRNIVTRVTQGRMDVELMDFTAENLAVGFLGQVTPITAGSVTSVVYRAYLDRLIPLEHVGATSVVVTGPSATPVYTAGDDYEVWESGLYLPATSGITDDTDIEVSYDYGVQDVIQGIMNSGREYSLIFSSLNEAENDLPGVLTVHRAKSSFAREWQMLGDDFGVLQLSFELLPDTSKGSGESAFFNWKQGRTA